MKVNSRRRWTRSGGAGLDVLLIVDEVVSRPEVFVIGQSTQFSGD